MRTPALLLLPLLLVGCDQGPQHAVHPITLTRTARVPVKTGRVGASVGERLGQAKAKRPIQGHHGQSRAPMLQIDHRTPPGWKERSPTFIRSINLQVAGDPRAECYLAKLPGRAGGLKANINRWRKEMGQGPLDQKGLAGLPKRRVMGLTATYMELDGTFTSSTRKGAKPLAGWRLVGVIVSFQHQMVFIKMTGPADVLQRERGNFEAFLKSLQLRKATQKPKPPSKPKLPTKVLPPRHPTLGEFDPASLRWEEPTGWTRQEARSPRLVSFTRAPGLELYVSSLSGTGGGDAGNVNRWRKQMGQHTKLTAEEVADLPRIKVLGREAPLVEIAGVYTDMRGNVHEGRRVLLGVICRLKRHTLYVKLIGPEEAARAQRNAFIAFCGSLK